MTCASSVVLHAIDPPVNAVVPPIALVARVVAGFLADAELIAESGAGAAVAATGRTAPVYIRVPTWPARCLRAVCPCARACRGLKWHSVFVDEVVVVAFVVVGSCHG